jgi:predicted ArsR family transcriptional regulator
MPVKTQRSGRAQAPGLGESQQQLLGRLKRRGSATIPVLAADLGLNVETVRHHLQVLARLGLVERRGTRRSGPGRPEVVYALAGAADSLFPTRAGEVLHALAAHLQDTGNEAILEAFFARYIDERRAQALARVAGLNGRARVEEVGRILSELGFMALAEEGEGAANLRLCHCPLRELVSVSRIPCRAEIGFIRELLGEDQLTRLSYIPAGDAACTYRTGEA